jgi:hypothetical protein
MSLARSVDQWQRTALPPANVPGDPSANPKFYNKTWVPWQDPKRPNMLLVHPQTDWVTLASVLGGLCVGLIAAALILAKLYWKRSVNDKVAEG